MTILSISKQLLRCDHPSRVRDHQCTHYMYDLSQPTEVRLHERVPPLLGGGIMGTPHWTARAVTQCWYCVAMSRSDTHAIYTHACVNYSTDCLLIALANSRAAWVTGGRDAHDRPKQLYHERRIA